ncbi:MAG: outer membrane protein assembly factor BamD [Pseudomonadota bacterium]|mgnify:CR=1 FL=1
MHTLTTIAMPHFARGLIAACLLVALSGGCANTSGKPAGADPAALRQNYLDGHRALEAGDFTAAAVQLKRLADGAPEPYGSQAALELTYAYYKQGDYPAARRNGDQFIQRYAAHPRADYVHYLRASAALRQAVQQDEAPLEQHDRVLREAYALFQDISERFPSSDFNENALHSLAFLRQQLALTHLKHAKAGLGERENAATMLRLRAVSEEFRGTPAAEEALALLQSPKPAVVAAPPAAQLAASATQISNAEATARSLPPVEPPIAIHDPRWILQQRPERYTVELLSAEPDTVNIFVTRHRIQGGASYPAANGGGSRQTLIHGLYPDAASANLAAKQLSKRWGLPTPKIRRLGELQSSLNGDSALSAAAR